MKHTEEGRVYGLWEMDECEECGCEFQVTRTESKIVTGRLICSDCTLYANSYAEGFERGYRQGTEKEGEYKDTISTLEAQVVGLELEIKELRQCND